MTIDSIDGLEPFLRRAGLEPFLLLDRDLKKKAESLTPPDVKKFVKGYYAMQQQRIRFGNQLSQARKVGEAHELLLWFYDLMEAVEKKVAKPLDGYSLKHPVGQWLRTICGIGPVLASGFLSEIDIYKAPYVGHIYNFAGYNPTIRWEKGQKRPWNASLKRLGWLAGKSFQKVQSRPRDVYGKIFVKRRAYEQEASDLGMRAEAAAQALREKNYRPETIAYQHYIIGKLPPAHIEGRARRFTVKIFLEHLFHVWYEIEFQRPAPLPYILDHLGHQSYFPPPYWPLEKDAPVEEPVDLTIFDADEEEEEECEEEHEPDIPPIPLSLAQKIARFKRANQQRIGKIDDSSSL